MIIVQKVIYFFILICFGIIIIYCTNNPVDPGKPEPEKYKCTWNGIDSIDYLDSMTCPDDFTRLQGDPLTQTFGEVTSVKVVYDIETDKLYYMESEKYMLHFDFCVEILGYPKAHIDFNREQYTDNPERKYFLPSINYYSASNIFTLEFAAGDKISCEQIELVYEKVSSTVYFGDELKFMPTSSDMKGRTSGLVGKIPIIYSDEIYEGQNYQPLNQESGYGYFIKVSIHDIDTTYLSPHSIVLTNGVPNDISVVSGIITTDFQTPLSHINVLSKNRGTPNMALRDGWINPLLNELLDKLVYLEVRLDSFTIREATLDEASAFWSEKEPSEPCTLSCNDSTEGLFDMDQLGHSSVSLVGAKAANFSELTMISSSDPGPVPVPECAFAIPFYYYRQHIKENGLDSHIENMLNDSAFMTDASERKRRLGCLQDDIVAAPVNSDFLVMVIDKIESYGTYRHIRFRSSTNAEDREEFNGAGLYRSTTGDLDDPERSVESAIKTVWASLWNFRAFEEREYFKINHDYVAMGILVHRSFPDELANGVAITCNIFNPNLWGYTINVQVREVSVVNPPRGIICDQFIFYTFYENPFEDPVIEYVSNSNINGGSPVLTDDEITLLAKYLTVIKTWFYINVYNENQNISYPYFGMDVEFKFDSPDRKLYIKQARPYK